MQLNWIFSRYGLSNILNTYLYIYLYIYIWVLQSTAWLQYWLQYLECVCVCLGPVTRTLCAMSPMVATGRNQPNIAGIGLIPVQFWRNVVLSGFVPFTKDIPFHPIVYLYYLSTIIIFHM